MKFYCCSFLFLFIVNLKLVAQNQLGIIPLGDFNLTTDTKWLANAFDGQIGDSVKYVGLGEVSHGSTELFQFKAKMIQYLIEEKGYRQIHFEYPNAALDLMNRYLQEDKLNEPAALQMFFNQIFGRMIRDKSFYSLFVWLKKYNLAHPEGKVSVSGFDMAGAAGSFVNYFKRNFMLEKSTARELDTARWRLEPVERTAKRLVDYISKRQNVLQKTLGGSYPIFANMVQNAEWEIKFNEMYKSDKYRASVFRDSLMTYNIRQLNQVKSILWAHNLHITTGNAISAGNYLKKQVGAAYYSILTDFSVDAKVVVFRGSTFPVVDIKADRKTSASVMGRRYKVENGIVLYSNFRKDTNTGVGFIDRGGNYYYSTAGKPFDALVFFKNLNPVEN